MHPDNNPASITLGAGQFFLKAPDGTVQQLTVHGVEEGALPEVSAPEETDAHCVAVKMTQEAAFAFDMEPDPAFTAWIESMVQAYREWMAAKIEEVRAAIKEWARVNRPDLYHVWRRTKKKRTRKKYWQRMVRAWRETA